LHFFTVAGEIPRRSSLTRGSNSKSKRLLFSAAQSEDDRDGGDNGSASLKLEDSCDFKPLYLISRWQEDETPTEMLSVAILLPSGIQGGDFHVRVVEGGNRLELKVIWPIPLIDEQLLHRKWLGPTASVPIAKYHPKFSRFQKEELKEYRDSRNTMVESLAFIPLPIAVQLNIHAKGNLSWPESTARIVYLDLKGYEE